MIGMMAPNVFAAEPYVSGSIVTSDDYLPWDRYIDVNGLRILGVSENTNYLTRTLISKFSQFNICEA